MVLLLLLPKLCARVLKLAVLGAKSLVMDAPSILELCLELLLASVDLSVDLILLNVLHELVDWSLRSWSLSLIWSLSWGGTQAEALRSLQGRFSSRGGSVIHCMGRVGWDVFKELPKCLSFLDRGTGRGDPTRGLHDVNSICRGQEESSRGWWGPNEFLRLRLEKKKNTRLRTGKGLERER
jgi:hypothetical protein